MSENRVYVTGEGLFDQLPDLMGVVNKLIV